MTIDSIILWGALLTGLAAFLYALRTLVRNWGNSKLRWVFGSGVVLLGIMVFAYTDSLFHFTHWQYAPQAYRPVIIGIFLFIFVLLLLVNFLIGIISGNSK